MYFVSVCYRIDVERQLTTSSTKIVCNIQEKKCQNIEDEVSQCEAEILRPITTPATRNLLVPNQVRPVIAANTYSQVQQKLQRNQQLRLFNYLQFHCQLLCQHLSQHYLFKLLRQS